MANGNTAVRMDLNSFPTWRKIESGGVEINELLLSMTWLKIKIGTWVKDASEKIVMSRRKNVDLVSCEVGDLGFTTKPTTAHLWGKVSELEGICDSDTPLHLRRKFLDQPVEDCLFPIMEFINWPPGSKSILRLNCKKVDNQPKLMIQVLPIDMNGTWSLNNKIVFQQAR